LSHFKGTDQFLEAFLLALEEMGVEGGDQHQLLDLAWYLRGGDFLVFGDSVGGVPLGLLPLSIELEDSCNSW
jgi:hypothetical protein